MRKITFFLSLFLAFAGITATAQPSTTGTAISDLASLSNSKAYWIKSGRGDGKYLLFNASQAPNYLASNWGSGYTNLTLDDNNCWKFAIYKSANTGKYYIYNLGAQKFVSYASANNANIPLVEYPTNDIEIRVTSKVAGHPFMLSTDRHGALNVAGQGNYGVVTWAGGYNDLNDTGNAFSFIEVTDLSQEVQNTIATRVAQAEGTPTIATDTRYNVKVTGKYLSNMPFSDNYNCLMAGEDVSNSGKAVVMLEKVTSFSNVYKIKYQQNQLQEEYKYLVHDNASGESTTGMQVLTEKNQTLAANDQWYLSPMADGMTFRIRPFKGGKCWNYWGGSNQTSAHIGLWGDVGGANDVVFEVADASVADAAAALETYRENYINGVKLSWNGTTFGYAPASAIEPARAAAAQTSSLYECARAFDEHKYAILPKADKFYQIKNAKVDGEVLLENYDLLQEGNYSLYSSSLGANVVPALWQFEKMTEVGKTDLFHIKNVNSDLYMSKCAWLYNMRLLPANGEIGEFDFVAKKWVDVDNAVNLWDPTHDGTVKVENDNTVMTWKETGCENVFFITEVTEIPVTISAAEYATLNLPFAVKMNADVKAYTVADGNGEVTLTEITEAFIPANTPVILSASAGTYNFEIDYANNDAAPLETALTGTTVPETLAADATVYILKNGTQGVGLYRVNSTTDRTIAANKAYLVSTTANAVKMFSLGGDVTGIQSVEAAKQANVYYDLQGRRVLSPANGVYVKGNGQKVFIK